MKKIVLLGALLTIGLGLVAFTKSTANPSKDKLLIEIISYVLSRGHFPPQRSMMPFLKVFTLTTSMV